MPTRREKKERKEHDGLCFLRKRTYVEGVDVWVIAHTEREKESTTYCASCVNVPTWKVWMSGLLPTQSEKKSECKEHDVLCFPRQRAYAEGVITELLSGYTR